MERTNHACLPSALLRHPEYYSVGKRSVERSVIAGLLAGGYRYLSIRKAVEIIHTTTKHKTTAHQVIKAFEELQTSGWIKKIDTGSYFRRLPNNPTVCIATSWEMTDKFKNICLQSNKFYKSLSDWRNRKPLSFESDTIKLDLPSYNQLWEEILPNNKNTCSFLGGLSALENNIVFFDRQTALQEYYRGTIQPKRKMPLYGITNLRYYPLKTGRLQNNPNSYLGKDLVPFITPNNDKYLDNGTLFSLDFKSQELRLLSFFTHNGQLKLDVQNEEDLFGIIHQRLSQYLQDVLANIKTHFYAITYGSNGQSLTEYLHHEMGAPIEIANSLTQSFYQEIYQMYPEIKRLQSKLEVELEEAGAITAPGGVVRKASEDDGITQKGK